MKKAAAGQKPKKMESKAFSHHVHQGHFVVSAVAQYRECLFACWGFAAHRQQGILCPLEGASRCRRRSALCRSSTSTRPQINENGVVNPICYDIARMSNNQAITQQLAIVTECRQSLNEGAGRNLIICVIRAEVEPGSRRFARSLGHKKQWLHIPGKRALQVLAACRQANK